MALLLSRWLQRCVVERKEVTSKLVWVRKKVESWVFIAAYGPGNEKREDEIQGV